VPLTAFDTVEGRSANQVKALLKVMLTSELETASTVSGAP